MEHHDAVAEAKRWMEVNNDGRPYFTRSELDWRIDLAEKEHAKATHVEDLKFWNEMLSTLIFMPAKDEAI